MNTVAFLGRAFVKRRYWLLPLSVVLVLSIAPVGIMGLFSPMIFDANGSEENPLNYLLLFSILSYPFFVILGLVIAWRAGQERRRMLIGLGICALPWLIFATSLLLIGLICNGKFVCDLDPLLLKLPF